MNKSKYSYSMYYDEQWAFVVKELAQINYNSINFFGLQKKSDFETPSKPISHEATEVKYYFKPTIAFFHVAPCFPPPRV